MRFFQYQATCPHPADPIAADNLIERFAALGRAEARLSTRTNVAALLRAIGGGSPYLSDLAVREARMLRAVIALGPERAVRHVLDELRAAPVTLPRADLMALLRRVKRQVALGVAIADLGGVWSLEQITHALSLLADTTLRGAVAHVLRAAHDAGELHLLHPERPEQSGAFTVLGMGKLGAHELNYSSDVDLVLLYDPAAHGNADNLSSVFTRLSRHLVALMETRDADGYVFRTDLRLRPDPGATPIAVSLPSCLVYYESLGQPWERAAMIKARPVAGDLALGRRFLREISPFVWRRHLDFAAIADLHSMKRRIDARQGGRVPLLPEAVNILGYNVKLDWGGIREIEFIAQSLQLAWAGRNPRLRDSTTLGALRALRDAGHLSPRATEELDAAYRFLRQTEHRLQMVADRQTHSLPIRLDELERFSVFMGFENATAFAQVLWAHLRHVRQHYDATFQMDSTSLASGVDLENVESLRAMGFSAPERILAARRDWQAGLPRALRSERARHLLDQLLPALLQALAQQIAPDQAFNRFDSFLSRLPTGVQILSLLAHNPALLERLANVLGSAPSLADHLARAPDALEGLLTERDTLPDPCHLLDLQLRDVTQMEDAISIIRRFVRGEEFRLSVADMSGELDIDTTGAARTRLAEAAIGRILPFVLADYESRAGSVPDGGLAVVALGKAGGNAMLAGSDLDLMIIYDHPPDITESLAPRPVAVSQYYIRAAHHTIAALTAPGPEGPLYAVDMRLRPSGNKGPVAVSLSAFERYHEQDAWTWERMALTRARIVASSSTALRQRLQATIQKILCQAPDPDRLREDARTMRARLARELPPVSPWDVKLRPGGLMEVEFIAQILQLQHAASNPAILAPETGTALHRLAQAGYLPETQAARLIMADKTWRTVQTVLRLTLGSIPRANLPVPTIRLLLQRLSLPGTPDIDLPTLEQNLADMAKDVRALFTRWIGAPQSPAA